ncbi:hypothetical protein V757_04765 [Pelistega indica]|uniref:Uncharacterized protein n=1 Tax=Pelistega indica TaxID=1414851 RepID=V8G734_9BURK|nr:MULTISPECIES: hypothetical protein [Pelistega]ETD72354.1 hypothetical protein V757_04765 [Pelistega indica]
MAIKDSEYVNQSQETELNYCLRKHGLAQSADNRKALKDLLPPRTRTEEADRLILANLDKFAKSASQS